MVWVWCVQSKQWFLSKLHKHIKHGMTRDLSLGTNFEPMFSRTPKTENSKHKAGNLNKQQET